MERVNEHFAVGQVRLEHLETKGNLFVMDVQNKTNKALPLGISVAVNDPCNVENKILPVPREHGSFSRQIMTIAARSKTTLSVPCEIKPVGANPLLVFSVFEPRPEYATYGEHDMRDRDVTLIACGAANLVKAAERGDCVLPPAVPVETKDSSARRAGGHRDQGHQRESRAAQPGDRYPRRRALALFGEPAWYRLRGNQTFAEDKLPNFYIMFYSRVFSVFIGVGPIQELRFEDRSDYAFHGTLRVGSTLDEALKVMGPPDRTVEGGADRIRGRRSVQGCANPRERREWRKLLCATRQGHPDIRCSRRADRAISDAQRPAARRAGQARGPGAVTQAVRCCGPRFPHGRNEVIGAG